MNNNSVEIKTYKCLFCHESLHYNGRHIDLLECANCISDFSGFYSLRLRSKHTKCVNIYEFWEELIIPELGAIISLKPTYVLVKFYVNSVYKDNGYKIYIDKNFDPNDKDFLNKLKIKLKIMKTFK